MMQHYIYLGLLLISKVEIVDALLSQPNNINLPTSSRRSRLDEGRRHAVVCCNNNNNNNDNMASTSDGNLRMTRKAFFSATTCLSILLSSVMVEESFAMERDPKTGIYLPTVGEIEEAIPKNWNLVDSPIDDGDAATLFGRLDTSPDAVFYESPRFGEHIDENAVSILTDYVSNKAIGNHKAEGATVLDLCSSWTSHIDVNILSSKKIQRVSGLGMNGKELAANPALTDWVVQDLNTNPILPYDDATFDVVLCQLSIDYLTRPLEVLRQVGRVMKPGGKVHILFSNRLFLSKAVGVWTGADDVDHAFLVGSYLNSCKGNFESITATDLSTRKGREKRIVGDPLYVVTAIRV